MFCGIYGRIATREEKVSLINKRYVDVGGSNRGV